VTSRFDYVTVGHVTRDVIEDRAGGAVSQPGGGAFYSALQAARLGLHTLIITQGVSREISELLEPFRDELDLHVIPAEHTTTLSTRGSGTRRSQRLLAWAGPIVEPLTLNTEILHLASVARETPLAWQGHADFVGLTPQGLTRHWEQSKSGDIAPGELDPDALPQRFNAAVISKQECKSCHALFALACRCGAYVAVTAGSEPATVHLPAPATGSVVQTSLPHLIEPREDLGAGDVFAATFFVALSEGHSPLEAATFGNAAAALRIARTGPDAVATRAAITL
jgi:hypothetical protein